MWLWPRFGLGQFARGKDRCHDADYALAAFVHLVIVYLSPCIRHWIQWSGKGRSGGITLAASSHMKMRLVVLFWLVSATFAASHKDADYKVGTMISWAAGNCGAAKMADISSVNCNAGGTIIYEVSAEGHEYTLTRNEDHSGILDSKADPLNKLLPKAEFKYRVDEKGNFWVMWLKNNKQKETKYSVRGIK